MTTTARSKMLLIFAAGAVLAAILLLGAWRAGADRPVLRSYEVKPEIAREVQDVLQESFFRLENGTQGEPLGRVSLAPNGRLIVTAPPSVQRGVADLLEEIEDTDPAPTPMIGFDLWLVTALPGGGEAAAPPAELAELEPALKAIRAARGPLQFELFERLSTTTAAGQGEGGASSDRARFEVEARLRRAPDGAQIVTADMEVHTMWEPTPHVANWREALEATVELQPGEIVVVGQGRAAEPGDVYYVLRARL
jgi:hypothetical protein